MGSLTKHLTLVAQIDRLTHLKLRDAVDSGDVFYLVIDRDPTPVKSYLLNTADADSEDFGPFEIKR